MTIPAASIISEVQTELQDPTAIRWTLAELVSHFNEAQVTIVTHRPDTNAVEAEFVPTPGALQQLPAQALGFVDIAGNAIGNGRNITRTDKWQLDAVDPNWQSGTKKAEILHFTYDLAKPRQFYLYPPASSAARIDLITGDYPTPVSVVSNAVSGNLALDDWTKPAVKAYVLFKAWSKDAEVAGNAALAKAQIDIFMTLLGLQKDGSGKVLPIT